MKYSIVMPVLLREPDHRIIVQQTIDSLQESEDDFELIIIDDGSPLMAGFLEDWADTFIQHETNLGIAPGWNDGLKAAKGEYIVIINDDIMVPEKWLRRMSKVLDSVPEAGVVGPMSAGPDELPGYYDKEPYEDARFFPGYCFMFKRDRWLEEFDTRFVPYNFEDADMWTRIMKTGLKLYRAPLAIWHKEGDVVHKMQYQRVNTENHQRFIDKWGVDPQPYLYGGGDIQEFLDKIKQHENVS